MTRQLHDVLNDIASDVPPTDLVAGVATRATQIRWMRRAKAGGAALALAAVVGVVTVGLPSWQQSTRPDRDVISTQPTAPLLATEIDLDAAQHGVLDETTGLAVVEDADGTRRTIALDIESGLAVVLDAVVPGDLESVRLTADGTRGLFIGATSTAVIDMISGETIYELTRTKHQPVGLSWDGRSVITFQINPPDPPDALPTWQLVTIDVDTGLSTAHGPPIGRSSVTGELFAAPDGVTVFVRYDGSVQDNRTHRLSLVTGETVYSEPYTALRIESMHWVADGSLLAAETTSLRIMTPNDQVGDLLKSVRKAGVPLGFAGPEHLVWWRPGTAVVSLALTDLVGNELQDPTALSTAGQVIALATALR